MIKVTTVIVNRANYGRLEPVLIRLEEDSEIESQILLTGTTVIEEYGDFERVIQRMRYRNWCKLDIEEGRRTHESMVCTSANLSREMSKFLEYERPDCVVLIGDRYETLGAAIAASYMNVPLVHIQGGEISGTIDGKIRHSISALSDIHLVATSKAAETVRYIARRRESVYNVGCPCGDFILTRSAETKQAAWLQACKQSGLNASLSFVVVSYHPNTIDATSALAELRSIHQGLKSFDGRILWFYPNSDASSGEIKDYIELIGAEDNRIALMKNLEPSQYIEILDRAKVCVGNSSSFVRDASFMGTPVVLVGKRQEGRELAENVICLEDISVGRVEEAIAKQLKAGRYKVSNLYGDGNASKKIHQILKKELL